MREAYFFPLNLDEYACVRRMIITIMPARRLASFCSSNSSMQMQRTRRRRGRSGQHLWLPYFRAFCCVLGALQGQLNMEPSYARNPEELSFPMDVGLLCLLGDVHTNLMMTGSRASTLCLKEQNSTSALEGRALYPDDI